MELMFERYSTYTVAWPLAVCYAAYACGHDSCVTAWRGMAVTHRPTGFTSRGIELRNLFMFSFRSVSELLATML